MVALSVAYLVCTRTRVFFGGGKLYRLTCRTLYPGCLQGFPVGGGLFEGCV